jgi:hypothetical protein
MKSARAAEANEKAAADIKAVANILREVLMVVLLPVLEFAITLSAGLIAAFSRIISVIKNW